MILGLSHIAISTNGIEAATQRLALMGYQQRFDEPGLGNQPEKQRFLGHYQPEHHIRALFAPGAMAIELLDHGAMTGEQAADIIPVFAGTAPLDDWQPLPLDHFPFASAEIAAHFTRPVSGFYDPCLGLKFLWTQKDADAASGVAAIVWSSGQRERVTGALRALRFSEKQPDLWSLMTPIASLMATVIVVNAAQKPGWKYGASLDAPGCPCLAFMARAIERMGWLDSADTDELTRFTLTVNRVKLGITMARVLNGPILELVESR